MPNPPKPISDLDQSKAGLQDDHDPRDIGQKQNDVPEGEIANGMTRLGDVAKHAVDLCP